MRPSTCNRPQTIQSNTSSRALSWTANSDHWHRAACRWEDDPQDPDVSRYSMHSGRTHVLRSWRPGYPKPFSPTAITLPPIRRTAGRLRRPHTTHPRVVADLQCPFCSPFANQQTRLVAVIGMWRRCGSIPKNPSCQVSDCFLGQAAHRGWCLRVIAQPPQVHDLRSVPATHDL
jgi:hypothetical protein